MTRTAIFASLTILALAVGGYALAGGPAGHLDHGHGHGYGHGHGDHGAHGFGQDHPGLLSLILDLDLDDEQKARLAAVRGAFHDAFQGRNGHRMGRGDHAAHILAKLEAGEGFDSAEGRAMVDQHIESMRTAAYAAVDEITALLDSLDSSQRATLEEHLRQVTAARAAE